MPCFLNAVMLGTALIAPVVLAPNALLADDHRYHDQKHNDDHEWNAHEDRAYRIYVKENHHRIGQPMWFRSAPSSKHVAGSSSADGPSKAHGKGTALGSRIARKTGNGSIVPGVNVAGMVATTFHRTDSPLVPHPKPSRDI
jgi:hypothetical protein